MENWFTSRERYAGDQVMWSARKGICMSRWFLKYAEINTIIRFNSFRRCFVRAAWRSLHANRAQSSANSIKVGLFVDWDTRSLDVKNVTAHWSGWHAATMAIAICHPSKNHWRFLLILWQIASHGTRTQYSWLAYSGIASYLRKRHVIQAMCGWSTWTMHMAYKQKNSQAGNRSRRHRKWRDVWKSQRQPNQNRCDESAPYFIVACVI